MITTKYYVHKDGFADSTAYLMVKNNKCTATLKNGENFGEVVFRPETCERYVKEGIWKRITAAEAEALLDKPPTPEPIIFTLDKDSQDFLNKIGVPTEVNGLWDLITRVHEAGIMTGESNAKRIIENALDNI